MPKPIIYDSFGDIINSPNQIGFVENKEKLINAPKELPFKVPPPKTLP